MYTLGTAELSRPFRCMGHCRDSGAEVSATGVVRLRESVRVYLWAHVGVLRSMVSDGGILVRSWFGETTFKNVCENLTHSP
jgi:hypothetical protein